MNKFPLAFSTTILLLTSFTPKQFPQTEYDQAYEALIFENYTQATKQYATFLLSILSTQKSGINTVPTAWKRVNMTLLRNMSIKLLHKN